MALTLREEVLKNSGLLTEEILEEGFFKKAAIISTIIAGLAGAAIFGPKVVRDVKQYNKVRNTPVPSRYEKVDDSINKDLKNKEKLVYVFKNLNNVEKIKSEYVAKDNQSIINVYVNNKNKHYINREITDEIFYALSEYRQRLDDFYSNIEDKISYSVNTIPLKVIIHFSDYVSINNMDGIKKAVRDSVWIDNVEIDAPKKDGK